MNVLLSGTWFNGPPWMKNENQWPAQLQLKMSGEVFQTVHHPSLFVNSMLVSNRWWERLSVWTRVVRLGARLLQWRYLKTNSRLDLQLRSERLIYRIIQEDLFGEDIAVLRKGKSLPISSRLFQISPFLDELGILRVGGRLQASQLEFEERHPIILGKHSLVEMFVQYEHRKQKHIGVEALYAHICINFWIIGGRRIIRGLKTKCITCRRFDAKATCEVTAPLPEG